MKHLLIIVALILSLGSHINIFAQTVLVVDDEIGVNDGTSPFATIAVARTGDIISITVDSDNIHTEKGIVVFTKG